MSNDDTTPVEVRAGVSARPQVPRPFRIAVVGATGVVGRETVAILEERNFPVAELKLLASERSAGEEVSFKNDDLIVEKLTPESFQRMEVVFFAAGGSISREMTPIAAEAGAVSIDKSSVFRMDDDVPLIVPEVNGDVLGDYKKRRLISTPNCSTIQLVQVLAPLHKAAGLKRVICSTYQAVSGAGKAGLEELEVQVRNLFNFQDMKTDVFGQRIAFNALPAIPGKNAFDDDGVSQEEKKMIQETRKILGLPALPVGVTCVRVPVFNGHSEAVHLAFDRPITPEKVRELLAAEPNVIVIDDTSEDLYPSATDAVGEDNTLVGRIRRDPAQENGIALWIVSDNLRTGAALNAVRIAEHLCTDHLAQESA
jgi:aspartate-semialdehyde dehydrogenase